MKKPFLHADPTNFICCILLATSYIGASTAAQAAAPDFDRPFQFSLNLSNADINLKSDLAEHNVNLDRIAISVFSQADPRLQLGFVTGSSYLTLDNDPPSAGMSLNGYHAGLAMRSRWGSNPQLGVHARYLYQDTRNETATQTVVLSWHEWTAGISATLLLGGQLELRAGWAHHEVDARRRATGNINETRRLELAASGQGLLGLAWRTISGGHMGVRLLGGDYRQVEFRFAQTFR
ncbi:MAG TPA: hypothetical protein ENI97_10085 [Gammaproteobacteria bacterium]|nr:hypothetical protein [Gammaproteobacteria bacterium]